ncbi:IS110 family transposase [Serratia ureilytica]|uniref:IS110 family transposase n=1 Tax=Serratia ureilytica TaxID=300181 RepID=UPI0011C73C04|nr:IS110 family transposase [Serratia ureilytica]TXE51908.1 IS110 family transposase [Serratia ureilytica]
MSQVKITGIDLAKTNFYLFSINAYGKPVGKMKLSRSNLLNWLVQQPPMTVAMEACGASHHWAREIQKLGHTAILLPAQHVRAYQRRQKNDYNDAQAIAEACQHGTIRPVPIKTLDQQDIQTFLKMRQLISMERTQLINHVRGLLAEYGIVLNKGATELRRTLPVLLEDAENELTDAMRALLHRQYTRLITLDDELEWYNAEQKKYVHQDPVCQRLLAIPGFGPLVSQVIKSWMGDGKQFKRGRDASAALGLVPRQCTTGGKQVLLGITKCGNQYVRSMLIHGARAVLFRSAEKTDLLSVWVNRIREKRGFNRAVVALVNKLLRISRVIIARNELYLPAALKNQ